MDEKTCLTQSVLVIPQGQAWPNPRCVTPHTLPLSGCTWDTLLVPIELTLVFSTCSSHMPS